MQTESATAGPLHVGAAGTVGADTSRHLWLTTRRRGARTLMRTPGCSTWNMANGRAEHCSTWNTKRAIHGGSATGVDDTWEAAGRCGPHVPAAYG